MNAEAYNISLVNLAADARSVAADARSELRAAGQMALRGLLKNFCEIDPIENALADTEIRVQARQEKYVLRTEQKKLILYDMRRRELPGQILTIDEALLELDGTASMTRRQAIELARAEAESVVPDAPGIGRAGRWRVAAWSVLGGGLLAGIICLARPFADSGGPPGFVPVEPDEAAGLHAALSGVYLTGTDPGQHGIAVTGPGELKLFEFAAVEAPRVVYAAYRMGRCRGKVTLLTDQPGGAIEIQPDGKLHYCGEYYQRIP